MYSPRLIHPNFDNTISKYFMGDASFLRRSPIASRAVSSMLYASSTSMIVCSSSKSSGTFPSISEVFFGDLVHFGLRTSRKEKEFEVIDWENLLVV